MKFPYGISDFYRIVTEEYFYVGRTACLPVFEAVGDQLLFLCPRRFGKSLLLSMLESSFSALVAAVRATSYPLYLWIDEYDNFAYEVLMARSQEGRHHYKKLVRGEGIFKIVFKAVKAASAGQGLE